MNGDSNTVGSAGMEPGDGRESGADGQRARIAGALDRAKDRITQALTEGFSNGPAHIERLIEARSFIVEAQLGLEAEEG